MLSISFLFAVAVFVLLLMFFAFLPDLRSCVLASPDAPQLTEPTAKKHGRGLPGLLLIMVLYSAAAFWNLGNMASPESFAPMEGRSVILEFPETESPASAVLFPGVGTGAYSIEVSNDQEGWHPVAAFTQDHVSVLKWQYIELMQMGSFRFLRIHCTEGRPWLGEIGVRDSDGKLLPAACSIPELCDEAGLIPASSNYMNSSYFDEIYHARTAWEHLHSIWPYEISHPPLGKEILALGILLFGMTPFGWRFSGTVMGILMLPVMYFFLQRVIGGRRIPTLGTILLASGFMHYAQTRIATIDSYAVFFIMLMFLFMYAWLSSGKKLDLALCGLSFGFGAACKWTCLYAGAGLGLIWLAHWILLMRKDGMRNQTLPFLKNALFCVLFFVLIPGFIYYLSYIPYGIAEGKALFSGGYTRLVLDNQSFMLNYHVSVKAEHPYASRWYQWILNIRPILYYLEYLPDGKRISIAAFVNPMICWGGLLSLIILSAAALIRHDRTALFLLAAYASGIVPWIFVSRLTFEYHYFASAVFLVPAISYVFSLLEKNDRAGRICTTGFCVVSVILFAVFFPVLNGLPIDNTLGSKLFGWLPSWPI